MNLSSGGQLLVQQDPREPVVSLQAWVKAGSRYENESEIGLCHLLEHMVFQAAESTHGKAPAEAFEELGGYLNAFTSPDEMVFYASLPSAHWQEGLELLCQLLFPLQFPLAALENEKKVVLEEINREQDAPDRQLFRHLLNCAFPDHPYGRPVLGDPKIVQDCTPHQLTALHQKLFQTSRMTFSVVGAVIPDEIHRFLDERLPTATSHQRMVRPAAPVHQGFAVEVIEKDLFEHRLAIGWPVPPVMASEAPALELFSMLWGQGASSPLEKKLCWDQQLVNEAGTFLFQPAQTGLGVLTLFGLHDNLHTVLRQSYETLYRLMIDGPSNKEFEKARAWIEASQAYRGETVEGKAHQYGEGFSRHQNPRLGEQFLEQLLNVTQVDIQMVARQYFGTPNASIVAHVPKGQGEDFQALSKLWKDVWRPPGLSSVPSPVTSSFKNSSSPKKTPSCSPSETIRTTMLGHVPIVYYPTDKIPAIHMYAAWRGGISFEPAHLKGVGTLTAEMLVSGTQTKTREEMMEAIDCHTTRFSPFFGRNATGLHFGCVANQFETASELAAQVLQEPRFESEDFHRQVDMLKKSHERRVDYPSGLAFELFRKTLWNTEHPYGRLPSGDTETLSRRKLTEIQAWHHKIFLETQPTIALVGHFNPDEIQETLERQWAHLARATKRLPLLHQPPALSSKAMAHFPFEGEQSHVVLGFEGLKVDDPRGDAFLLLMACLGGQSGRLFQELREKRGLCYQVQSFQFDGMHPGATGFYLGCANEKVTEAIVHLEGLIQEICAHPLDDVEVERARKRLLGQKLLAAQSIQTQSAAFCINQTVGLPYDQHLHLEQRLNPLTALDLQRVAQEVFLPQKQVVVVVGHLPEDGPKPNIDAEERLGLSPKRV